MALRTPPSWLQNGTHPADNDRLTVTNSLYGAGGMADYGALRVSQSGTPGMSVQIAAGHAIIPGTQVANQGFYIAYNDSAASVAIATADPSLPRIDRICVVVQDSFYSGANNQVIFQAVTGTPASSPVPPAAPNNALSLALVAVAAGTTSIVDANITDVRVQAKFKETLIKSQATQANSLQIEQLTSQTGKAVRIDDNTGVQKFAIGFDGVLTFQDGSVQNTAATYDPNLIINNQTGTTYQLVAGDAQKVISCDNASPITLTVPSNATAALPAGTQVSVLQFGTGQVEIVGASSPNPVTIYANPGRKTRAQYSLVTLIQLSTNTWLLTGDSTA